MTRSARCRFRVADVGVFARCAAHAAVERPGYDATPGEDCQSDEGQDGADADEDCSFGEVRFLHVGCAGGGGHAGGGVVVEFWEAGFEAAEGDGCGGGGGERGEFGVGGGGGFCLVGGGLGFCSGFGCCGGFGGGCCFGSCGGSVGASGF